MTFMKPHFSPLFDIYNIKSIIHEMYLQKVRKSKVSAFDEKRR